MIFQFGIHICIAAVVWAAPASGSRAAAESRQMEREVPVIARNTDTAVASAKGERVEAVRLMGGFSEYPSVFSSKLSVAKGYFDRDTPEDRTLSRRRRQTQTEAQTQTQLTCCCTAHYLFRVATARPANRRLTNPSATLLAPAPPRPAQILQILGR